jgi:hypothetical protein
MSNDGSVIFSAESDYDSSASAGAFLDLEATEENSCSDEQDLQSETASEKDFIVCNVSS